MFDDFKELLSVFSAHSVKYLVVGGYAVSFYAQPRDAELYFDRPVIASAACRNE